MYFNDRIYMIFNFLKNIKFYQVSHSTLFKWQKYKELNPSSL
jgi:hypothetical protein